MLHVSPGERHAKPCSDKRRIWENHRESGGPACGAFLRPKPQNELKTSIQLNFFEPVRYNDIKQPLRTAKAPCGERKVDRPIHKAEFFKELRISELQKAVLLFANDLKSYAR